MTHLIWIDAYCKEEDIFGEWWHSKNPSIKTPSHHMINMFAIWLENDMIKTVKQILFLRIDFRVTGIIVERHDCFMTAWLHVPVCTSQTSDLRAPQELGVCSSTKQCTYYKLRLSWNPTHSSQLSLACIIEEEVLPVDTMDWPNIILDCWANFMYTFWDK